MMTDTNNLFEIQSIAKIFSSSVIVKENTTRSRTGNQPQPECRNGDNCGSNIKSVSLQSREEMISLHNTLSDGAAVALITKSIQLGAPGSLSTDKAHVVPDVCRGEDKCTCLQN